MEQANLESGVAAGGAPVIRVRSVEELSTRVLKILVKEVDLYESHASVYDEFGMPWMKETLRRLPPWLVDDDTPKGKERLDHTVATVSLAGLFQNNAYLPYGNCAKLIEKSALSVVQLQRYRIWGQFEIKRCANHIVYKLAEGVPWNKKEAQDDANRRKEEAKRKREEMEAEEAALEAGDLGDVGPDGLPPDPLPLEVEDPQELDPNCDTYVDHPTDVPYFLPIRSRKAWAIEEEAL